MSILLEISTLGYTLLEGTRGLGDDDDDALLAFPRFVLGFFWSFANCLHASHPTPSPFPILSVYDHCSIAQPNQARPIPRQAVAKAPPCFFSFSRLPHLPRHPTQTHMHHRHHDHHSRHKTEQHERHRRIQSLCAQGKCFSRTALFLLLPPLPSESPQLKMRFASVSIPTCTSVLPPTNEGGAGCD